MPTDEPVPDAGPRRRRGRALAALALALAVLGAAGPLAAQTVQDMRRIPPGVLHPGIGTEDPRRGVDPAAEPWHALGRVQTELGGRCTGVLVGPRTVLTAAHCLMAPRSGRLVQPRSAHFMLGYHLGAWSAHARVVAYAIGPGFTPDAARPGPSGADWALLTLDRPMTGPDGPARPLPLLRDAPTPPGTPLMFGGYQRDRPEALLADMACRALGHERRPSGHTLLVHDCAGTRGASGAPLLARGRDGRWGVAGVASTIASAAGGTSKGHAVPALAIDTEMAAQAPAARP